MLFNECPVPQSPCIKSLITTFSHVYDPGYSFPGEAHDFWELVAVTDGKIGVCAGSDIFALEKGQIIIHAPMEFHSLRTEGRDCAEVIIISFKAIGIPKVKNCIFTVSESDLDKLKDIKDGIRKNFKTQRLCITDQLEDRVAEAGLSIKKFEVFLCELFANRNSKGPIQNRNVSRSAKQYAEIMRYIDDNLSRNLTTDDIAAHCSMSRSNLKKIFSKYSGMGIMKYYSLRKIQAAEVMLKDGYSVSEVSAAFGFCDPNYFSTVYKKHMGVTPSSVMFDE